MIQQIVYVSRAVKLMSSIDLSVLLEQSRKRNSELSLTGMLLYKDKSFIQLLEGPSESVKMVIESIKKDRRHIKFSTLVDKEVKSRVFNQWSMSFVNLDVENNQPEGFVDYFSDASIVDDLIATPSKAVELLAYFRARG